MNRRTLLWATPAVVVATAAPSFATSPTDDPTPALAPVACRRPGVGKNSKDYFLRTRHRDDVTVLAVLIGGREAEPGPHGWEVREFKDSRIKRDVVVTYVMTVSPTEILHWSAEMAFPVCEETP